MSERPAGLVTGTVAVGWGLVAFLLAAVGPTTVGLGAVGLLVITAGYTRKSRRLADAGCAALFCEVVVATVQGLGPMTALAAAVALVLAWTFGHSAIDLHATLGSAHSRDLELTHLAGTTGVTVVAAAVALAGVGISLGDVAPSVALAFLLGAVGLTVSLRH